MHTDPRWTAVDAYFAEALLPPDPILDDALQANAAAGLPAHDVSPLQGQFLALLTQAVGARQVLEIGTLGGYSTIWFARAVGPEGRVVTLELDADRARVAAANLARAGVAGRVSSRTGRATDTLAALAAEGSGPFDLVFIDADKPTNPEYLAWALRLARPGTLIIGDNVVRDGAVADAASTDANVVGVRSFIELLSNEPRVRATALQTVGAKGYDGFVLALVQGG
jgi:predicted O-methyltransferase YrrM